MEAIFHSHVGAFEQGAGITTRRKPVDTRVFRQCFRRDRRTLAERDTGIVAQLCLGNAARIVIGQAETAGHMRVEVMLSEPAAQRSEARGDLVIRPDMAPGYDGLRFHILDLNQHTVILPVRDQTDISCIGTIMNARVKGPVGGWRLGSAIGAGGQPETLPKGPRKTFSAAIPGRESRFRHGFPLNAHGMRGTGHPDPPDHLLHRLPGKGAEHPVEMKCRESRRFRQLFKLQRRVPIGGDPLQNPADAHCIGVFGLLSHNNSMPSLLPRCPTDLAVMIRLRPASERAIAEHIPETPSC